MNINEKVQLALVHYRSGNLEEAEKALKQALELQENNSIAINLLGIMYYQNRNYDLSIQYMKKSVSLNPNNGQAYYILGHCLQEKGDADEAIICYQKSLSINPDFADAHYNLGTVFQDRKEYDSAISCYRKAVHFNPRDIDAIYNIGLSFEGKGEFEEAINSYQEALQLNPNIREAYARMGFCLQQIEQFDAVSFFKKVNQLNPNNPVVLNSLGLALRERGQLDEAIDCYRKALDISANDANAYYNLGVAVTENGQLDEAVDCYRKALQISPDFAYVHWNLSLVLLLLGNFEEGWKEYEWRWKEKNFLKNKCFRQPIHFAQPRWDGSSLKGKTLLIYSEQGIGDEVMFASCFQEVVEQAARCIIECEKRLVPIFSRSFPKAIFLERVKKTDAYSSQLPRTDMVIPSGSLPKFLRTDFNAFPQKSYLIPDPRKVHAWLNRVKSLGKGLSIGISWRGGTSPEVIRKRSITLEQWNDLFSLAGAHFINLQYGNCENELKEAKEKFDVTIHDWKDADPRKDLDNFAAEIFALDLVISVDNTTVHMAGALGKPVWVLLPFVPNWRWMLNHEDSPWYSTVRLFRQPSPEYWEPVMAKVKDELIKLLNKN
jgi:tetratricopeptide (TPR) repeat protein